MILNLLKELNPSKELTFSKDNMTLSHLIDFNIQNKFEEIE